MPRPRRSLGVLIAASAVLGSLLPSFPVAARERAAPPGAASEVVAGEPGVVTLRGTVACLEAEADRCNQEGARFELRAESGERVGFLASDPRAAIFVDPRVRARTLEVSGWRRAGGAIEILSIHSIVDGKPHHLHYRCDVCNITTTAPGPCWCCGQDFELREEPIEASADAEREPR